jgi:hypothetical protein
LTQPSAFPFPPLAVVAVLFLPAVVVLFPLVADFSLSIVVAFAFHLPLAFDTGKQDKLQKPCYSGLLHLLQGKKKEAGFSNKKNSTYNPLKVLLKYCKVVFI